MLSGANLTELSNLINNGQYLINEVENAKESIKSKEEFYDFDKYKKSMDILKASLRLLSMAYFPTKLSFYSYEMSYSAASTSDVLMAVKDNSNIYIDFYNAIALPGIISNSPDIIGISINEESQVIPGMTLAYMIKNKLPQVHIVILGKYFTYLKNYLKENKPLFTYIDSIIVHEAETAFVELIKSIEANKDLNAVPNLIYVDGVNIIENTTFINEDLDKLPTPCYDDLPLNLYLSPQVVLPLYATRGCYWGKCAFCNFHLASGGKYRCRNSEKVLEDIKILSHKHNCELFLFIDEALTPKFLQDFSRNLKKSEISTKWGCHARFEKQMNKDFFINLYYAGCVSIAFGFESACDRVLKLMDKGTDSKTIEEVLSNSFEAGIASHLTFFFGFPTETKEEAKETIEFVLNNLEKINSLRFSHYLLVENSMVFQNSEIFNISKIYKKGGNDLSLNYDYEINQGMSQKETLDFTRKVTKPMFELYSTITNFLFTHNALYPMYYKTNDITWITADKDKTERNKYHEERRQITITKINELFKEL